jgi:hypothetical protein
MVLNSKNGPSIAAGSFSFRTRIGLAEAVENRVNSMAASCRTAVVRKRLNLDISLSTMLMIFPVMPVEKISLQQALSIRQRSPEQMENDIQLSLFEFQWTLVS